MTTPDHALAEETLAEVGRLRSRTQARAHAGAWLPAVGIALLLLGSIALYRYPFAASNELTVDYPYWAGLPDEQRSPTASYVYWFVGTPLTFAVVGGWYWWRARRLGMRVAWPLFAVTGLGVLVLLAVLAAIPSGRQFGEVEAAPAIYWPALQTPLLPVAAAVVALGWAERSRALAAAGVWIALLALWLCGGFPLGRVPGWMTWVLDGGGPALGGQLALRPGHYVVIMAVPLLGFAGVRGWRAARAAR